MNRKSKQQARQPKTLVFARCVSTYRGIGARIADIFMSTYTASQWSRKPKCPNCGGDMVKLYEGKTL